MAHRARVRCVVAAGALLTAVAVIPAMGTASAQPGDGPLIETTCSYSQLDAALQAQAPELAALLDVNPTAQAQLRRFVALPVAARKQLLRSGLSANPQWLATFEQQRDTPEGQEREQTLMRVAATCQSY